MGEEAHYVCVCDGVGSTLCVGDGVGKHIMCG